MDLAISLKLVETGLVLLLIYYAAAWDHCLAASPPFERRALQAGSTWLLPSLGALYLLTRSPESGSWNLLASAPHTFSLPMALSSILVLFLAWEPLRTSLLQSVRLDPHRLLHGLLFYHLVNELLYALFTYPYHFATGIPALATDSDTLDLVLRQIEMGAIALLAVTGASGNGWSQIRQRLQLQPQLSWKTAGGLLVILTALLASHFSVVIFFPLLFNTLGPLPSNDPALLPAHDSFAWDWLLIATLGAAISEELFFRGLLQPRLGILWTSLLFTVGHLYYALPGLISVFVSSLFFGWTAKRYGLWACMLLHGAVNLTSHLANLLPTPYWAPLFLLIWLCGNFFLLRWLYRRLSRHRAAPLARH